MKVSKKTPKAKRYRTLAEKLVAEISQEIDEGKFKAGDKLPTESGIMQKKGVSRTVVREAISRLQAAGLVETLHGIGTFVLNKPLSANLELESSAISTLQDVIDIMEMRIGLEVEAARLAARRRTEEQLQVLGKALKKLLEVQHTGEDGAAMDIDFHLQIAMATGNRYIAETLKKLGSVMVPRSRINMAKLSNKNQSDYLTKINLEHENIYAAIARGDAEDASAAMRLHLTNSRERLQYLKRKTGQGTT
jgi:GntR family transcriptional repressor for pyruvate dehydrogenase complex